MSELLEIFLWIGAACTAAAGLLWAGRTIGRTGRSVANIAEDWNGEPARPGVPARAGVMERLARIEGELTFNGGGSLKDKVVQLSSQMERIERQLGNAQPVNINFGVPAAQSSTSPAPSA